MTWNIGGLTARLQDQGFVNYIFKFDIVCLVETFIDKADNLSDIFSSFDIFLAPAQICPCRAKCQVVSSY